MEKVRQGEQVVIKASTWNGFVDAANFVKEAKQNTLGGGIRSGIGGGIVPLKNMEDRDYPRFSALVITGVAVSPSANEDEFVSCPTVFEGQRMIAEREDMPYAVLLEPIAAHEIGRAMLLGLTPAKVLVQSADDQYAVPKANSDDGALESSETGVALTSAESASSEATSFPNAAASSFVRLPCDLPFTKSSADGYDV